MYFWLYHCCIFCFFFGCILGYHLLEITPLLIEFQYVIKIWG
ncbi:hypothetical protein EVA_20051 [gut metagenome]|uniref:Uncharacterized protein n=1 Tax=gut metagenome TaxID=749906 RepID=J9FBN3_9ZZZZ